MMRMYSSDFLKCIKQSLDNFFIVFCFKWYILYICTLVAPNDRLWYGEAAIHPNWRSETPSGTQITSQFTTPVLELDGRI